MKNIEFLSQTGAIQTDLVKAHATTTSRNFKVGRNNIAQQGLAQLLAFSQIVSATPYGYCALRSKSRSLLRREHTPDTTSV
jgi:hypothetical protein